MNQHTPGPWQVVVTKHPHRYNGEHVERRIFTLHDHPQLKAPYPIVSGSVGVGLYAPIHMVSISNDDACLIAAAPELLEVLREAELVLAEKLNRLGAQPNASPTYRRIRAAIAKATGGNHGSL